MDIDNMTIGQLKQINSLIGGQKEDNSHWEIGANYLLRTVTHIDTGRLIKVTATELVVEDAAWIADTGRYSDSIKDNAKFNEVEPYPDGAIVIVNRASLIDAIVIETLPRKQK